MKLASLLGHVAELYRLCTATTGPLDAETQRFFAERRYLGRRDRTFITDALWDLLRGRLRWQAAAELAPASLPAIPLDLRDILIASFVPNSSLLEKISKHPEGAAAQSVEILTAIAERLEPAGTLPSPEMLRANFTAWENWAEASFPSIYSSADASSPLHTAWPEWLTHALHDRLASLNPPVNDPAEAAKKIMTAFSRTAPLHLRVNTLRITRDEVSAELAGMGIEAHPSPLAADALVLKNRLRLISVELYKQGDIEVQDAGSQCIALALEPQPNSTILDACAGGGGKSLHLAALMNDTGTIYATDQSLQRLAPLRERAQRAEATNIRMIALAEALRIRELDALLIDAPCTGVGTLRRNPALLWRLTPDAPQHYAMRQAEILQKFAPTVAPGGVLLYATCSFLRIENDAVIEEFLRLQPDWKLDPPENLPTALPTACGLQLFPGFPGDQDCDAFYISRLRKTSA